MKKPSKNSTKSPKKVRSDWLTFTAESDEKGRIFLDWGGSQVLANGKPVTNVKLVRSYPREGKKEKVLTSILFGDKNPPITGFTSQWDPNVASIKRFDHVLAVDTNTKFINGLWVASTAAWIASDEWKTQSGACDVLAHSHFIELHQEKPHDAESRGWYSVLNYGLNEYSYLMRGHSVALVVDSRLGDHDSINAGKIPYFANSLLPPCFTLTYASDAASDSLFNVMIKHCDKAATENLRAIESGKLVISDWRAGVNTRIIITP